MPQSKVFSPFIWLLLLEIIKVNAGPLIENREKFEIKNVNVENQKNLEEKKPWTTEVQKKKNAIEGKARQKFESEQNSEANARNFRAQNQTQFEIESFLSNFNENKQNTSMQNASKQNTPVELSEQKIPFEMQNADENRKNSNIQRNFQLLVAEVGQRESHESALYDRVVKSLIKFIKFLIHRNIESDFTLDQVIQLARIFQRVIQIKSELLKRLFQIASNLRHSKSVQMTEVNIATGEIACLQKFNACINLEVIAQRLSSPKLEKVVDGIAYLLPDAKLYENELDACLERQRF